jgi:hypothetical protein
MAKRIRNGYVSIGVLFSQAQIRLIAAIHRVRDTQDHPVSKATVIREALTVGLEEQRKQFNVEVPADPTEIETEQ